MLSTLSLYSYAQPAAVVRVQSGQKAGVQIDTVLYMLDSLRKDSTLYADFRADSLRLDSIRLAKIERKEKKFSLTKDTISPGNQLLLSFVPGMGQIYNRQYWKAPVFVGAMGGFIAGGVMMGNTYKATQNKWQEAVDMGADQSIIDGYQRDIYSQKSATTWLYIGAGVTYLYSIADATFNYRGDMNNVRKATVLAALFPGAGFFYTRDYWRIPIYYGGFAVMASVISYNGRYYERFKTAYNLVADGDDSTVDEFGGRYSETVLQNARDTYRRNRDLGIIALAGVYMISIIDTYVLATLKNWDVSPDLAVVPKIFNDPLCYSPSMTGSAAGLSLQIRF